MEQVTKKSSSEIIKKKDEIQTVNSPAEMIKLAVSGGADLDKLEKLLSLQERWDATEAKKAYHRAMAEFKVVPLKIEKDRKVNYKTDKGSVKYNHASLANIVEKITKELGKYGLSASWRTQQNGQISVTCRITHIQGHSEETTLSAQADSTGSKNSIQAIGSTISYLSRYSLLAILGLAAYDQDDDGISAEPIDFIDEKQRSIIFDHINSTKTDEAKFLQYLEIKSIESMPKSIYQKALNALKTKENKNAKS